MYVVVVWTQSQQKQLDQFCWNLHATRIWVQNPLQKYFKSTLILAKISTYPKVLEYKWGYNFGIGVRGKHQIAMNNNCCFCCYSLYAKILKEEQWNSVQGLYCTVLFKSCGRVEFERKKIFLAPFLSTLSIPMMYNNLLYDTVTASLWHSY